MGREDQNEMKGLSRRDMLKRMAIGGAVAWSAPIIMTFNSPAFAQVTSPPCDCPTPADPCSGQTECGEDCWCVVTVEGECFCHQTSNCVTVKSCTSSSECPPGWACAYSCCGELKCLPPCGTFVPAAAEAGGGARSAPPSRER